MTCEPINIRHTGFRDLLLGVMVFITSSCFTQTRTIEEVELDLIKTSARIFPFYYKDQDSLAYYSNLFDRKFRALIYENPESLNYSFKKLCDSKSCRVATSEDKTFRVYSWDTWLGGTMHKFKNIYQFKSGDSVYTTDKEYGEEDFGTMVTEIYSLKAHDKIYYLVVSGGSFSSKDAYETVSATQVCGKFLNDTVPLFKTPDGLVNYIHCEFDFFSVVDQPERPVRLIKYDGNKKILYIPIVLENGQVTGRYTLYQFKGQYFEHLLTQKPGKKKR